MLQPARWKYRKEQKAAQGLATNGAKVSFGEFGLKAVAAAGSPPGRSRRPAAP